MKILYGDYIGIIFPCSVLRRTRKQYSQQAQKVKPAVVAVAVVGAAAMVVGDTDMSRLQRVSFLRGCAFFLQDF